MVRVPAHVNDAPCCCGLPPTSPAVSRPECAGRPFKCTVPYYHPLCLPFLCLALPPRRAPSAVLPLASSWTPCSSWQTSRAQTARPACCTLSSPRHVPGCLCRCCMLGIINPLISALHMVQSPVAQQQWQAFESVPARQSACPFACPPAAG